MTSHIGWILVWPLWALHWAGCEVINKLESVVSRNTVRIVLYLADKFVIPSVQRSWFLRPWCLTPMEANFCEALRPLSGCFFLPIRANYVFLLLVLFHFWCSVINLVALISNFDINIFLIKKNSKNLFKKSGIFKRKKEKKKKNTVFRKKKSKNF